MSINWSARIFRGARHDHVTPPIRPPRVIYVHDGSAPLCDVAEGLRAEGLDAGTCGGDASLLLALSGDCDLVLLGMAPLAGSMHRMPGSLPALLRAAGFARPIVALLPGGTAGDEDLFRQAGCTEVLTERLDAKALCARIQVLPGPAEEPRANFEDEEFLGELRRLEGEFRAGLPERIETVRRALSQSDWTALTSASHQLRGTAASYGHARLGQRAAALEQAVNEGEFGEATALARRLLEEARAIAAGRGTA